MLKETVNIIDTTCPPLSFIGYSNVLGFIDFFLSADPFFLCVPMGSLSRVEVFDSLIYQLVIDIKWRLNQKESSKENSENPRSTTKNVET